MKTINFETGALKTEYEKENHRPLEAVDAPQVRVVVPHPSTKSSEDALPTSVYLTPRRGAASPTAAMYRRPKSVERTRTVTAASGNPAIATPVRHYNTADRTRCTSAERRGQQQWRQQEIITPTTPVMEREGRSQTKTSPRLRQRLFTSLERKADRVLNLLTPKKMKMEGPVRLNSTKV